MTNEIEQAIIEDEVLERRDDVVEGLIPRTFKTWLRRNAHDYPELAAVIAEHFGGAGFIEYRYRTYAMRLMQVGREDLMDTLLQAETDWNYAKLSAKATSYHLAMERPEMALVIIPCGYKRDGVECGNDALPGSVRCKDHGGDWIDPKVRYSILLNAYARLVEATDIAVDALVDVAQNGKREDARVMAAREILDRAGIRGGGEAPAKLADGEEASPMDELTKRLADVADRLATKAEIEARLAAPDPDIEDAEVISDSDEVPNAVEG